jgi:hypothetical protein
VISFCGVIVDDVKNHLDSRGVELTDHLLKFLHGFFRAARRITRVRGEKRQAVITPVIRPTALQQKGLVEVIMNRQQLNRGDAEFVQVVDRGRGGKAGVSSAQVLRNIRMLPGETFDM